MFKAAMIEEYGTVIELKGKHVAIVIAEKGSFCKNCASMEACKVGDDNRSMLIEAHNPLGAQVGNKVKVVTSTKSFLQSSFTLYIMPLIAMVIGALIGQGIGERMAGVDPNLLSAFIGVAFLVGAFLVIRVGSRAIPKEAFMPRIAEIIIGEEVASERNGY
jgi:sigma-E factor negative regulatory protein RseC